MTTPEMRSQLRLARKQFQRKEPVTPGFVRAEILESWIRSRAYGLEFDSADAQVPAARGLAARIHCRRKLYELGVTVMEKFCGYIAGSGWLCALADEEGCLLHVMGDKNILPVATREGFVAGAYMHESRCGTNGVGTALASRRPVCIRGEEHYSVLFQRWACSGAPIFDHSGKIGGVFCVAGLAENVSSHALALAAASAESISQQIVVEQALGAVENLRQSMQMVTESVPSGVLLCNQELEVVHVNAKASSLVSSYSKNILGHKVYDVFRLDPFESADIFSVLDGKNILVKRDGSIDSFSVTVKSTATGDYVIAFSHSGYSCKESPRTIGSELRFTFADIIGQAPLLKNALALARIAANNSATVLLSGESGTGKELFAQAIHSAGSRCKAPFVALNCAALPKSIIESELFGYERGSFTGARKEGSPGKFELANGGTIFLDEIGDMPLDVQASLLRVLQSREVSRLGCSRAVTLDVRVIAASNRNLLLAVEEGMFRADLFYRLNVFNIHIPPLRDRVIDIPLLADYFLRKYACFSQSQIKGFTQKAYIALQGCVWNGNVRELENVIERAVYITQSEFIDVGNLSLPWLPCSVAETADTGGAVTGISVSGTGRMDLFQSREGGTAEVVRQAFLEASGNMGQAAGLLGVSRRTLYRKMTNLNMNPGELRRHMLGKGLI